MGKPFFLVAGNPVEHSLSPRIHAAFGQQLGISLDYTRRRVEPGEFGAVAAEFAAHGGSGMNVTVPFKLDAFEFADSHSDAATAARAANTLTFADGGCRADNTDGIGLLNDLARHEVALAGATVVLLGAGGAARGVLAPLLSCRPARLIVQNRTASRAAELVDAFATRAAQSQVALSHAPWSSASGKADLVINATAAGLLANGFDLAASTVENAFCYDMSYGHSAAFRAWAAAHGARRSVDGLGMLVEQAAESFYIWHGVRPTTAPVLHELREIVRG